MFFQPLHLKNEFSIIYAQFNIAGWSSMVARQAHNLKVAGSNPAPATNFHYIPNHFTY